MHQSILHINIDFDVKSDGYTRSSPSPSSSFCLFTTYIIYLSIYLSIFTTYIIYLSLYLSIHLFFSALFNFVLLLLFDNITFPSVQLSVYHKYDR